MATLTCKRGDTLTINGTRTDAAGDPESLGGATVACEIVRNANRQALTCAIVSAAAGTFTASLPAATTATLSIGIWQGDIEFTDALGAVVSTETFLLSIVEDVTNAG